MELIVPSLPVQMIVLVWEHVILQQEHAHAMLDVTDWIALWYVPMIVLVWEHVIQAQEPAFAIMDFMAMTALLFALMTALVWEHVLFQHQ